MTLDEYHDLLAERRARVQRLTHEGRTAKAIAVALGITPRTVQRIRGDLGIAKPKPPILTDDEKRLAATLLDDGASYEEVARTIGRSAHAVRLAFPGRGWTREQCGAFRFEPRGPNRMVVAC
ncbi:MAG TPA: helix-turn-helix domain-containing protein [Gemmatimonadaceae bacterium]